MSNKVIQNVHPDCIKCGLCRTTFRNFFSLIIDISSFCY